MEKLNEEEEQISLENNLAALGNTAKELDTLIKFSKVENPNENLYEGITFSTEDALTTIKNIAEYILEKIYELFNRFLDTIVSTRNQAENRIITARNLLERLDEIPDLARVPAFDMQNAAYITVTGDTPTPVDMLKGLRKLRAVFSTENIDNTEYSIRMIDRVLPKVTTLLNKYDVLSYGDATRLTQLIAEDVYTLRKKYLQSPHLKQTNDIDIFSTETLLGIAEVHYKAEPVSEADLRGTSYQLTSAMEAIVSSRGYLKTDSDSNARMYRVLAANKGQQRQLLENSIDLLNLITQYHIRYYKKIQALRENIKGYRNRYNSLSRNNQNDQSKVYLRKISRILHALSRWLYSPSIPLLAHSLKASNGVIQYCQRSQAEIKRSVK